MILRSMFDHVTLRVGNLAASRRFYATLLGEPFTSTAGYDEWEDFGFKQAEHDGAATSGLHLAFVTQSRTEVDAFWRRGLDAGYASDGEPGVRPEYGPEYYGAFLRDPDGNSVEAVYHGREREPGFLIDHLWIGVADLDEAKRFWRAVSPVLGLAIKNERPERFHVAADQVDRASAFVADGREPTRNVHLAIAVPDDQTVAEFHRVALAAGFRDNGGPGERPEYHAGYVGAFVLDPDGNNVEAVNHNR
jgi:catechol 2,3-dioxygenase-like lactoylglutathione lyase family enzyme